MDCVALSGHCAIFQSFYFQAYVNVLHASHQKTFLTMEQSRFFFHLQIIHFNCSHGAVGRIWRIRLIELNVQQRIVTSAQV